jgi:glutamate synthase (ferredoxin)
MSGGIAYVLDRNGDFAGHCNQLTVDLQKLEDHEEIAHVQNMIQLHAEYTNSELANRVLADWDAMVPRFVKVMPRDYQRVLDAMQRVKEAGLSGDAAVLAAFEENKREVAARPNDK